MEQHLLDAVSKLSTSHLLILLVGYSIGKIATYLIHAKRASNRARVMQLTIEVERLKRELSNARQSGREKKAE